MARGRKKALPLNEQLEQVKNDIADTENKLRELRAKKKQLELDIKADEQKEIISIIQGSGKSLDEIKVLLAN